MEQFALGESLLSAQSRSRWQDKLLLHVIWLTSDESNSPVPVKFHKCLNSWPQLNSELCCVLWLDKDARALVESLDKVEFFYRKLLTPVERADWIRMRILHVFGGIYVDVDMQSLLPVVPVLQKSNKSVALLQSSLFSESFQSCIIVARSPGIELFEQVALQIEENVNKFPEGNCGNSIRAVLAIPFVRQAARSFLTVWLTGPANIDRVLARSAISGEYVGKIQILDHTFYNGPLARHHEAGSWTHFGTATVMIDAIKSLTFRQTLRMLIPKIW